MHLRLLTAAAGLAGTLPVTLASAAVPVPVVSGGGPGWSGASSLQVRASGAADGAGYQYRMSRDGGLTWSDPADGRAATVEAEGETRIQFRVVDAAATSDWAPGADAAGTGTVRLDRRPPGAPQVSGGVSHPASASPVRVRAAAATDEGSGVAGYQWRTSTDGGRSWSDPAPGDGVDVSAEGETLVQFRALDAAGNAGAWAPEHVPGMPAADATVRIDRTPPPPPEGLAAAGFPVRLAWSASPEADAYLLLRGGRAAARTSATAVTDVEAEDLAPPPAPSAPLVGIPAPGRATVSWRPVEDRGTLYTYAVRAVDAAGNASGDAAPVTVSARSGIDAYSVLLDGRVVAQTAGGTAATLTGLDPAVAHTVVIRARDAAGQTGEESPALGFMAAPGPSPRLTVLCDDPAVRPGRPLRLAALVAGHANSIVRWSFDDDTRAQGPVVTHAFASAGVHRVAAEVAGATGSPVRVVRPVVVDGTAPSARLMVHGTRLRVAATDRGAGIAAVEMLAPFRQPVGAAGVVLPEGPQDVRLVITDRAGNATELRRTLLIDGSAPVVWVTAPRGVAGDVAEVTIAAGDGSGLRPRLMLGGRPLIDPSGAPVAIPSGTPIQVDATDASGNTARVSVLVARMRTAPGSDPALDGRAGNQLRYLRSEPVVTGPRRRLLVEVQDHLRALGLLPRGWRTTTRYTDVILRAVQTFQRGAGLPAMGTVGPATRRAMAREAARPVVFTSG